MALLVCVLGCRAALERRVVGVLVLDSRHLATADALEAELSRVATPNGWHLEFVRRQAGDRARLRDAAEELVDANVDVMVAITTPAAVAAKQMAEDTPLIFTLVSDPVAAGLVDSLRSPGGNVTGVLDTGATYAAKRLEYLVRAHPGIRRVLLPHARTVVSRSIVAATQEGAQKLGVELVLLPVNDSSELDAAFAAIEPGDVDALYLPLDAVVAEAEEAVLALTRRLKIPAIGGGRFVKGVVFGFGESLEASGTQAARLVARVLAGVPPRELPVETPRLPRLRLYTGTARDIGYLFADPAWWLGDDVLAF